MASSDLDPMEQFSLEAWNTSVGTRASGGKNEKSVAIARANKLLQVKTPNLEKFDSNLESDYRIVVGVKGTGKTTALLRKAARFLSSSAPGYLIIPHQYPFVMTLDAIQIPKETNPDKISHYFHAYTWTAIWKLVFGTIFVHQLRIKEFRRKNKQNGIEDADLLPDLLKIPRTHSAFEFFDKVGATIDEQMSAHQELVSPILQLILERHYDQDICSQWYNAFIKSQLVLPDTNTQVAAIFVDGVDEALRKYSSVHPYGNLYSPSIWDAAQAGIVDTALDIEKTTSGTFRIYSSIRDEAFRTYAMTGMRNESQVADTCLTMTYSTDLLHEIFEANIAMTKGSDLALPKHKDPIVRFLGQSEVRHSHVINGSEPILQWIIRHTFGRPRELVWQGKCIHDLPKDKRKRRATLSQVINETGDRIFKDYIAELSPGWRAHVATAFKSIKHNIITRKEAEALDESYGTVENEGKRIRPISYLYSVGLIGIPDQRGKHQSFLAYQDPRSAESLPEADYFFVHPCLDQSILGALKPEEKTQYFSHQMIVGNHLMCLARLRAPKLLLVYFESDKSIKLCHIPDNQDVYVSVESLPDSLSKQPGLTNRAQPKVGQLFAITTLIAMYLGKRNLVTTQDIVDTAAALEKNASDFYPNDVGHKPNRGSADHYLLRTLPGSHGDNPAPLSGANDFLGDIDPHLQMSRVHEQKPPELENRTLDTKYEVKNINWFEIQLLYVSL